MRNKLLSVFIAFVMLLIPYGYGVSAEGGSSLGDDLDSLENRLDGLKSDVTNLKSEERSIERKLKKLGERDKSIKQEIDRVDRLLDSTIKKISDNEADLVLSQDRLDELTVEIRRIEAELSDREADFRDRVSAASNVSFLNYLEVVVKADSFGSMLANLAGIRKVVDEDNRVIEEYIELSDRLADSREEAEREMLRLERLRVDLVDSRKELDRINQVNRKKSTEVTTSYAGNLVRLGEVRVLIDQTLDEMGIVSKYIKLIEEYGEFDGSSVGDFRLNQLVDTKRKDLLHLAELEGIRLITTSGLRTFAEQDALYAKGRTVEGSVVTNARAGESWHNYGVAFDVAFDNGYGIPTWEEYDMNGNGLDDWEEIGKIGTRVGLEWGGYWTEILDRPHFQYTFGKDMDDMKDFRNRKYLLNVKK